MMRSSNKEFNPFFGQRFSSKSANSNLKVTQEYRKKKLWELCGCMLAL